LNGQERNNMNCPRCGLTNAIGATFCRGCGSSLGQGSFAPAPDWTTNPMASRGGGSISNLAIVLSALGFIVWAIGAINWVGYFPTKFLGFTYSTWFHISEGALFLGGILIGIACLISYSTLRRIGLAASSILSGVGFILSGLGPILFVLDSSPCTTTINLMMAGSIIGFLLVSIAIFLCLGRRR